MKLLLKGGRVDRPGERIATGSSTSCIEDGRIARVGKIAAGRRRRGRRREAGLDRRARADRHPRAPARAGAGAQGNDRHRRRRRPSPAASPPSRACRTPIRSTTIPASPSSSCARRPRRSLARVYPIGAVSIGSSGEQLAELGEQKAAGCVAFTDDGRPVATALLMRRALEYAGMLGVPIIDHCEDPSLKGDGVAHEGLLRRARSGCAASPARPSRSWSSATSRWPS